MIKRNRVKSNKLNSIVWTRIELDGIDWNRMGSSEIKGGGIG